jgi:chromosome segregation ATPase
VTDEDRSANSNLGQDGAPETAIETEVLRREVQLLRERIGDKEAVITDLKERLDQSEQERREKDRQLTALLTDHREKAAAEPEAPAPRGIRGFLHRLKG